MNIRNNKPSKKSKWKQSYFYPTDTSKFIGKIPAICRSSWELKFCIYCDTNIDILKWASEPLGIKYYYPKTKKYHTYYPDFFTRIKTSNGLISDLLIEVKPFAETKKPTPPKRKTHKALKNYIYAVNSYTKNYYKAQAAKEFCRKRGWKYTIITEKSIK